MKVLGIETVTRIGSIALIEDGEVRAQAEIDTYLAHGTRLLPAIKVLLESVKVSLAEIDRIAVDIGPGSFTGIRVGIATALGLAHGKKKVLAGVCSLDVLARQMEEYACGGKVLVPVIDAKRGCVYTAFYKKENGMAAADIGPRVTETGILLKNPPGNLFIFGPDMDKIAALFMAVPGVEVDKDNTYPQAGMVGLIGEKKKDINGKLEPLYLHSIDLKMPERK